MIISRHLQFNQKYKKDLIFHASNRWYFFYTGYLARIQKAKTNIEK